MKAESGVRVGKGVQKKSCLLAVRTSVNKHEDTRKGQN